MLGIPILLVLALGAAALFTRRVWTLLNLVKLGKPVERTDDVGKRVGYEATIVLGQRKLLQRAAPGLMHAFIFWGFLVLFTTIIEALGQVFSKTFAIPFIGTSGWLGFLQDVFAVLVIIGVEMAIYFRKGAKQDRFIGSHMEEADFILLMILGIMGTLLCLNAVNIALGFNDSPIHWMPVSNFLAWLIFDRVSQSGLNTLRLLFLWSHILLILGFLAYIPYSKHLHIITSFFNVFFSSTKKRGKLRALKIDPENLDENSALGAATLTDLTWKEMLDTMTCTECGRCQNVCPAWNTGKELSPKLLIMNLRDHMFDEGPRILEARKNGEDFAPVALNPGIIEDQVLWDCTTCGACMQECPVNIEHIDHIVDMRRNLVMGESRFPSEAGVMLRNLENAGNPWGMPQATKADWADGLGVRILDEGQEAPEYVYWVGCAGSFDDRAKKISEAVVGLLQKAGVPFAILGPRENCTGDPARRIGNEFLFETLAVQNVETLNAAKVRKVIANCPHCFNTLANEYPDYGGNWEVIHHTQLLDSLVSEGRLTPTQEVNELISYHDPCYLGRHNDVYDEPRRVLDKIPGVTTVEMPRHKERGMCCGAGGARMWLEEHEGKRINMDRMDEACATGCATVGVACPYCLVMLDDGAKAKGSDVKVADVAQVVARSVGTPSGLPTGDAVGAGDGLADPAKQPAS